MNPLDELKRFQTDRGLEQKTFSTWSFIKNIAEEMWELVVAVFKRDKHEKVDALADIAVFALGDIMKLGYDPEKVLVEVAKEINSREGTFIDGKFRKHKTPEAMRKWYKANFEGCKL